MSERAIVVVTGAGRGVGEGICKRLIEQLCYREPPDAFQAAFDPNSSLRQAASRAPSQSKISWHSLTLVLPCRSMKRGEEFKLRLLRYAQDTFRDAQQRPNDNGYAEQFIKSLEVDILHCDLAVMKTVLEFAEQLWNRYPYISHIINNAGTGSFIGVDLVQGLFEFFKDPVKAVTAPSYKIEATGERTSDGLGLVWQCNLFGHYALYRELLPRLRLSPFPTARVVWMSSLEAANGEVHIKDLQNTDTKLPYEDSKAQLDLVAVTLDRIVLDKKDKPAIRHIVVHPGVASTDILGAAQLGVVVAWLKLLALYVARWFGSRNHTITLDNSAVSATHAVLTPLFDLKDPPSPYDRNETPTPFKFSSQTDRSGKAYVDVEKMNAFEKHGRKGLDVLEKLDEICDKFIKEQGPEAMVQRLYQR